MLNNKVYAISGCSGRIGESFTKCILENNGRVLLGDININKTDYYKKKIWKSKN